MEQAVETEWLGPRKPKRIAINAAAIFPRIRGTKYGLTLRGLLLQRPNENGLTISSFT